MHEPRLVGCLLVWTATYCDGLQPACPQRPCPRCVVGYSAPGKPPPHKSAKPCPSSRPKPLGTSHGVGGGCPLLRAYAGSSRRCSESGLDLAHHPYGFSTAYTGQPSAPSSRLGVQYRCHGPTACALSGVRMRCQMGHGCADGAVPRRLFRIGARLIICGRVSYCGVSLKPCGVCPLPRREQCVGGLVATPE